MHWPACVTAVGHLALAAAIGVGAEGLAFASGPPTAGTADIVLQRHDGDASGCNRAVATVLPSGRVVAGLERKAYDHGFICGSSLVSLRADGSVAQELRQGAAEDPRESAIFRVNDEISEIVGLEDDVLVVVSEKDEGQVRSALTRLDARGEAVYRIAPLRAPDFSAFGVIVAGDTLFVSGSFGRGTYQLPGGEAWKRGAWATPFIAAFDLASGGLRWAKTVDQTGEVAADGPGLVGAFIKIPSRGREARPSQLVVRRYAADGRVAEHFQAQLPPRTDVTDVAPTDDGGVAVLTETCEQVDGGAGRKKCRYTAALRFFDAAGAPAPAPEEALRGRLALRAPGAPLRHVAPADLAPLDVGRSWQPLHGSGLVVATFGASGAEPRVARIELPGTWFEANDVGLDTESAREGVLVATRTAVRDPRSANPSGISSATTVIFRRLP